MVKGKGTRKTAPAAAGSKDTSSHDEQQSDAEGVSTAAAPEPAHDLDDELSPSKVLEFESGDECDGLDLKEKEAYRKAAGMN